MELTSLTVTELQSRLRSGEVSPVEALEALDQRIEQVDPVIHGYLSRDFSSALAQAKIADVSLPLGGVPIAIKDVINVLGEPCTCASKILRGYNAPYNATVIRKLIAAGAIPFGRTNMDEFAMGSS
ncbi:MAG: amidase, partial [Verrucomicrobiota bacterium]